MAKILKNTTGSDIVLKEIGLSVPASGQLIINNNDFVLLANSDAIIEVTTHINSGDLVYNDGVNDVTVANGFILQRAVDNMTHPGTAFGMRFAAEPERSNGFSSKNIQEAIEEAKIAIEGKVSDLPTFLNNGVTKDKWLALDGAMSKSDVLPSVTSFASVFSAITYVNGNDDSDLDLVFYKNGTDPGDIVFTWEIRNKRHAFKTNGLTSATFAQGDRIGCFAKEVTSGSGGSASSVIVNVLVKSTNSLTGEGGSSTL